MAEADAIGVTPAAATKTLATAKALGAPLAALLVAVIISACDRTTGDPLAAGQPVRVMQDQYTVTPPDSRWARIAATDDPDVEDHLAGPHEQKAIFYRYEDDSIDSLMRSRRDLIAVYESRPPECRETRTFDDEHGNVETLLVCRTEPSFGTRTLYTIKAIDDGDHIAEILVSANVATMLTKKVAKEGEALAESFRPAR